eukprot:TRINITY_DN61296_c0_g1_i1.p1 TRINITY_DN61296_c0_g1~~TRINITY_DN61296_c0_g1_i1.p1  ORF type:complete len:420 (+),score=45.13 TRINITY_DN61296_c0_g1_i1:136-1395(+)
MSVVNEAVQGHAGDGERPADLWFHRAAAFVMLFGPGSAVGLYVSMVGFYVANFKSRSFFLAMVFCVYIPCPIVWFLQSRFDESFDKEYSTKATYFFRVAVVQIILAGVFFGWACAAQKPYTVLIVGALIGFCAQAITLSSMQMIAMLDTTLTPYANIGLHTGSVTPVIAFLLAGFTPHSRLSTFKTVVLTVPFLWVVSSAFLGYLYGTQRVFQGACKRLDSAREEAALLLATRDDGLPRWIWLWVLTSGCGAGISVCMISMMAFFGDPQMAQTLSLIKLAMDLLGASCALPVPQLECFRRSPGHAVLAIGFSARMLLTVPLLAYLAGSHYSKGLLICLWMLFHLIHTLIMPLIAATLATFASESDRKMVQRMNTGSTYAGAVIGLLLAASVLVTALNLGGHWPRSDLEILAGGASKDGF